MSMELVITMKTRSSKLNSLNGKTKPNGKISYEDFLAWCDEDIMAEWVDGDIIMVSPASKQHQRILRFLTSLVSSYVELKNLREVLPVYRNIGSLIQSGSRRSSIDWAQIITTTSFCSMKKVSTVLRS